MRAKTERLPDGHLPEAGDGNEQAAHADQQQEPGEERGERIAEWQQQREAWTERDVIADAYLYENPLHAQQLCDGGLFGSLSAANRWLNRRYDWGKIYLAGKKRPHGATTGRYRYYFCSRPLGSCREHELVISDIVSNYFRHAQVQRTNLDPRLLPDFVLRMRNGILFNGELDNRGNMSLERMRGRFKKYAGSEDPLLLVTTQTDQRVDSLLSVADDVSEILCCTTLAALLADPWGRVWKTVGGQMLKIDQPVD